MYRVLITDDEKIEREGIKFLLAQEEGEYEIHEAANGRQALNVLRSEEIDFLLTDIKMPPFSLLFCSTACSDSSLQSPDRRFGP